MVVRSNEQITNYYFAKNCVSKNIWFFLRLKMHATSTPKLIADWRGCNGEGDIYGKRIPHWFKTNDKNSRSIEGIWARRGVFRI